MPWYAVYGGGNQDIWLHCIVLWMYRKGTKRVISFDMHRVWNMDACNRVTMVVFVSLLSIIRLIRVYDEISQEIERNARKHNTKSMINSWHHCHSTANYLTSRFSITHDVCNFWLLWLWHLIGMDWNVHRFSEIKTSWNVCRMNCKCWFLNFVLGMLL